MAVLSKAGCPQQLEVPLVSPTPLRVLFALCRFMPPDDPLGRHGPSLDNFLRKRPLPSEHRKQPCPYGETQLCPSPHLCPRCLLLGGTTMPPWDQTAPSFPATATSCPTQPCSLPLQGGSAPTGSSAGSSTLSGPAAPCAPWLMSSVPMPSSRPPGPLAKTKVASGLPLPLSLALCPQRVSRAARRGRSWGPAHPQGLARRG